MASTYEEFCKSVDLYNNNLAAYALGLTSEAGEVAGKVKKLLRGDYTNIDAQLVAYELGDVLWYLVRMANNFGYSLDAIANMNMDKLQKRVEANTIRGNGDHR